MVLIALHGQTLAMIDSRVSFPAARLGHSTEPSRKVWSGVSEITNPLRHGVHTTHTVLVHLVRPENSILSAFHFSLEYLTIMLCVGLLCGCN
jgi:hypothetical protein